MPVSGQHKPPKLGNAYASTLELVLGIDIGIDNGNGEDDEGIAHANGLSAMGKEGKDISGNRGTGGKLQASVPTLGAVDALELRAPSATGVNPRQPTTASTIAAFPFGFFPLRLRRMAPSCSTVNLCTSSAQVNPVVSVEGRTQASCYFDAISSSRACLFLASSSSFAFRFSAAVRTKAKQTSEAIGPLSHNMELVKRVVCGVGSTTSSLLSVPNMV